MRTALVKTLACGFLFVAGLARADQLPSTPASPDDTVSGKIIDQQALEELYDQVTNEASSFPDAGPTLGIRPTPDSHVAGWYCVAAPYGNTFFGYTWWLSSNLAYSQYMALGNCTRFYGYVCAVACRWQF